MSVQITPEMVPALAGWPIRITHKKAGYQGLKPATMIRAHGKTSVVVRPTGHRTNDVMPLSACFVWEAGMAKQAQSSRRQVPDLSRFTTKPREEPVKAKPKRPAEKITSGAGAAMQPVQSAPPRVTIVEPEPEHKSAAKPASRPSTSTLSDLILDLTAKIEDAKLSRDSASEARRNMEAKVMNLKQIEAQAIARVQELKEQMQDIIEKL